MLLDCQLNVHGALHGNRIHIFRDVDCGSQTAVSNIVPKSSENVNKETISFTTPPTSSVEPPGLDTSINNEQIIKISGLDGVRPRLLEALFQIGLPTLFQVQRDKAPLQIIIRPC